MVGIQNGTTCRCESVQAFGIHSFQKLARVLRTSTTLSLSTMGIRETKPTHSDFYRNMLRELHQSFGSSITNGRTRNGWLNEAQRMVSTRRCPCTRCILVPGCVTRRTAG